MEQRKEFKYRGKNIEELKKMDTREFAKLLTSRARRDVLRGFQEIENFVNHAKKKISKGKRVKTHKRHLIIVPEMVGMNIRIYNGREFSPLDITGEMIGHKLGEFSLTRSRVAHTKAGVGATKGTKHKSKK